MHVHNHPMNFNAVDLSSARATEKAASAQRAADVRSQLMRGGMDIEGEANPFESFMIGRDAEGSPRQQQGPKQSRNQSNAEGRLQIANNKEQEDEPLSFWA